MPTRRCRLIEHANIIKTDERTFCIVAEWGSVSV